MIDSGSATSFPARTRFCPRFPILGFVVAAVAVALFSFFVFDSSQVHNAQTHAHTHTTAAVDPKGSRANWFRLRTRAVGSPVAVHSAGEGSSPVAATNLRTISCTSGMPNVSAGEGANQRGKLQKGL